MKLLTSSRNSNSDNSRANSLAAVAEEEWEVSRGEIMAAEAIEAEEGEALAEEGEEEGADYERLNL